MNFQPPQDIRSILERHNIPVAVDEKLVADLQKKLFKDRLDIEECYLQPLEYIENIKELNLSKKDRALIGRFREQAINNIKTLKSVLQKMEKNK